ncbi:MAG: DUF924 domain-containing protein [Acidiferrobacteraceae bacterium]|jgi:uncharacterized protein (DUF924 family)
MTEPDPRAVLDYWFGDALVARPEELGAHFKRWFRSGNALDGEIRERFGSWVERAATGGLDDWRAQPGPMLALILLLDQFPRNIWRGDARAFAHDALALRHSDELLASGRDRELHFLQRGFSYMPHQHIEDLAAQDAGVAAYQRLVADTDEAYRPTAEGFLNSAREHREIIRRFGRFPHRNAALGRASTEEEAGYLREGGKRFGQ